MQAAAMLLGTVIGAGIFGVPYAIVHGGTGAALVSFIFVGFVVIFFYLLYGEVVLRTRAHHRLPGFAERYLGVWGKRVATVSSVLGVYGVLTAHLIIGGIFLQAVLGPYLGGGERVWVVVYFLMVAVVSFFGLGLVSRVESWLTILFLALIAGVTLWALPHIRGDELWQRGRGDIFLPYGVIFFSLLGSTAIPQMRDALGAGGRLLRATIIFSLAIAIVFTTLFAFTVVGVSGSFTTQDALSGLRGVLGNNAFYTVSLIGLLTVITTSFAVALYLREVYQYDFKFDKITAWLLVIGIPFLFYIFVSPSLINTLSVTGAVMGGLDGILITLMHRRAIAHGDRKPEYAVPFPRWFGNAFILVFIIGIILEVIIPLL